MGEIEVRVSDEEFERIKRRRDEIGRRFTDLEGLERTLAYLRYSLLLEHRERLRAKLEELEKKYEELVEFEKKAREDKAYLMKVRRELSEENAKLRKMLEARK